MTKDTEAPKRLRDLPTATAVLHEGITDAQVEAARNAMVRVDSVYLPAKIIRRALEAAFENDDSDPMADEEPDPAIEWWLLTFDFMGKPGSRLYAGPFSTKGDAIAARAAIEPLRGANDLFVDHRRVPAEASS